MNPPVLTPVVPNAWFQKYSSHILLKFGIDNVWQCFSLVLHSRSARRGGVFLHSAISTPILLFIPLSNSRNVATNTSKKVYQAFMPIFDTGKCWDVEIIRYLIRCTYCCCYQVETIPSEICSSPFSASDNAVSDRDVHTLNYLAHAEIPLLPSLTLLPKRRRSSALPLHLF